MKAATRLLHARKGAALVEYGILVGMISVLSIGAVLALGEEVSETFETIEAQTVEATATATAGGTGVATGLTSAYGQTATVDY